MNSNYINLKKIAVKTRIKVLKSIYKAESGHLGSSFSTMEMLVALYFGNILNLDPSNPKAEDRDYFLLSNGHACPALYAILAQKGYFPTGKIEDLRKMDSGLEGHPRKNRLEGIEISSGSLGMGLSQGIGIALGIRQKNLNNRVVVMMSDGEQQEGSTWEAVMAASYFKLNNLTAIIDRNGVQIGGFTKNQMQISPLKEKYESFGWNVKEVDGHDFSQIIPVLKTTLNNKRGPSVIISRTLPCKDISFLEKRSDVHHPHVDEKLYSEALKELRQIEIKITDRKNKNE